MCGEFHKVCGEFHKVCGEFPKVCGGCHISSLNIHQVGAIIKRHGMRFQNYADDL